MELESLRADFESEFPPLSNKETRFQLRLEDVPNLRLKSMPLNFSMFGFKLKLIN